jgi:hypothetical protein
MDAKELKQRMINACAVPIAEADSTPIAFTISKVIDCVISEFEAKSAEEAEVRYKILNSIVVPEYWDGNIPETRGFYEGLKQAEKVLRRAKLTEEQKICTFVDTMKEDDKRKGNQFWKLRSKHGRDKLFKTSELLWEAACQYFQWCDDNPWIRVDFRGKDQVDIPVQRPYTISGLCLYLDCNDHYLSQFKAALDKDEKDFSSIITRIEKIIYTQKFEGAAVGAFNSNIIARDLGLKENVETSGSLNINPKQWAGDEEV